MSQVKMVAVDLNETGEFALMELVEVKRGWYTVLDDNGIQHKVRTKQVAIDEEGDGEPVEDLTDEDAKAGGDVFPEGIRERYAKGKLEGGKAFIDCGDDLARQLRGMSLEDVARMAKEVVKEPRLSAKGWLALYTTDREAEGKAALNPGMVRMNIGNRIRAALKKQAEEAAE